MSTRSALGQLTVVTLIALAAACGRPAAPGESAAPARSQTGAGATDVSLVVANGIVVTMDGAGRILSPGSVAIRDNEIVAVDTPAAIDAQYRGRERIDATGHIVLPGLINTHTHAPMVLYRGQPA